MLTTITKIASFSQKRQNQARRRAITSSSRSWGLSWPNRLGDGISRRNTSSATPRKTMIVPAVATSDHRVLQPLYCLNQTKTAGLVSTATMVAARVSWRHWDARRLGAGASWGRRPAGSATAIGEVRRTRVAPGVSRLLRACSARLRPEEEIEQERVDELRRADVGPVAAARDHLEPCVRHRGDDPFGELDGYRGILVAVDDERRARHVAEALRRPGPDELELLGDDDARASPRGRSRSSRRSRPPSPAP